MFLQTDPEKSKPFLGGGVERDKKNKNVKTIGGGKIDKLKLQLTQIHLSKDDLQTKRNNWFKVYNQMYEIGSKYQVKTIEPSNLKEKILELNKTKDIDQLIKIATEEINSFGDRSPGTTQTTFFNIMHKILTGKKTKTSEKDNVEKVREPADNTDVDTSKAHKFSVPLSTIEKFVRDYYSKNVQKTKGRDDALIQVELKELTGEINSLIKKWVKYQTSSSQEQLKGKKGSEEIIKKGKQTLGINEGQIVRWKQLAGIMKG